MCMLTESSPITSILGFFFYIICKYTILEVTTQDSSTVIIHRYHTSFEIIIIIKKN